MARKGIILAGVWHPPAPRHLVRIQATTAGIRQAYDLLPAQYAIAGWYSRHTDYLDASGYTPVRATAG